MKNTMHAIHVESDSEHTLTWRETTRPEPEPDQVLIEVRAAGVNRADLSQRRGAYPPPPGASPTLGLECAGVVAAVGDTVTRLEVGDDVFALLTGGGYAEYTTAHEGTVELLPDGLNYTEGAAVAEVYATAYLNLFVEAGLKPGDWALIHAGASGVGTASLQLCRALGVHAIATASTGKQQVLRDLGAHPIDRLAEDFLPRVKELTGGRGVDVILDPVGADYLERNVDALSAYGRLVIIGLMGGRAAELNLGRLMVKRLRVIGSVLRARPDEEKAALFDRMREEVWPMLTDGTLEPIIHATYPIANAQAAHEVMARNENTGKLILVRERGER
ncbi:MAG: NAD(P)H-quinone oxidoreductase [Myxococcota bacterium]